MINVICICGAGTMGSGIAQVCAAAGFRTILYDLNESAVKNAGTKMEKDLQALADKQKIDISRKDAIIRQILFTSEINDCKADLVIEAVVERMDVKLALFKQLASINGNQTIFASNTSSLSISELAAGSGNPERTAGLHFFNPAPLMKLVEVVKGMATSDTVTEALTELVKRLGKVPVVCKDSPGFIVNRVARPYYIEALRLAEEEASSYEVTDRLLESRGFRMGPFKLMDLIGNDINYAVSCSVYEQSGKPERLKPSHLQKEKVEKGDLGRKTKKGYFDY